MLRPTHGGCCFQEALYHAGMWPWRVRRTRTRGRSRGQLASGSGDRIRLLRVPGTSYLIPREVPPDLPYARDTTADPERGGRPT